MRFFKSFPIFLELWGQTKFLTEKMNMLLLTLDVATLLPKPFLGLSSKLGFLQLEESALIILLKIKPTLWTSSPWINKKLRQSFAKTHLEPLSQTQGSLVLLTGFSEDLLELEYTKEARGSNIPLNFKLLWVFIPEPFEQKIVLCAFLSYLLTRIPCVN